MPQMIRVDKIQQLQTQGHTIIVDGKKCGMSRLLKFGRMNLFPLVLAVKKPDSKLYHLYFIKELQMDIMVEFMRDELKLELGGNGQEVEFFEKIEL